MAGITVDIVIVVAGFVLSILTFVFGRMSEAKLQSQSVGKLAAMVEDIGSAVSKQTTKLDVYADKIVALEAKLDVVMSSTIMGMDKRISENTALILDVIKKGAGR